MSDMMLGTQKYISALKQCIAILSKVEIGDTVTDDIYHAIQGSLVSVNSELHLVSDVLSDVDKPEIRF